jgi:hypothetical protein
MFSRKHYESDDASFPSDAYRVKGYNGVAWTVLGWETEPDEETEWSGCEDRTGQVVCVMVGDDRHFSFDPGDLTPLPNDAFCRECGQIGCRCNVYA